MSEMLPQSWCYIVERVARSLAEGPPEADAEGLRARAGVEIGAPTWEDARAALRNDCPAPAGRHSRNIGK